jgi:hypothetical protein
VSLAAFADGAWATLNQPAAGARFYADAGVGLQVKGMLFDQPVTARVDVPVWVRRPGDGAQRIWWSFALNDLW